MTNLMILAQGKSEESKRVTDLMKSIYYYFQLHPPQIFMDLFENVEKLLHRATIYNMVGNSSLVSKGTASVPNYIVLTSESDCENINHIRKANLKFPIVCKPLLAHGSPSAHQMALIFSEKGVKDCMHPCVAQTFVKHGANLFKIFVVGRKHCVVQRSSLQDYVAGDFPTLFFDSQAISKSTLNSLHVNGFENILYSQNEKFIFASIAKELSIIFNITLFGADVIVEKDTGYEGGTNFHNLLADYLIDELGRKEYKFHVDNTTFSINSMSNDANSITNITNSKL